ncbi:hypothetical protein HAPAU_37140 [Halalkalicoccus paucihalophilus]|uniref:DUF1428 domain-containing protein n=1 Tax=Halalkalicoccus paucihalophilus TaxID=1008153 RepID=A0A151A9F9_9EURY|nr:DUF1428 domain-containing protein [Halalkalicoccus paucihalophilus]KYH24243.1 hypothetical protein HAPAU_37140 [Halalkalicoccus paucihalophilus]
MQPYVDGFVLPIPNDNVDEYREMAAEAGEMWINHGALEYFEGVGDELNPDMGEETVSTFPEMAKAGPDETVVFAFIVYQSEEHRNEVNAAVMAEMEGPEDVSMPFDMERMAFGGFRSLVSLSGDERTQHVEGDKQT